MMQIKYDVEIPKNIRGNGKGKTEEYDAFINFVESSHRTMCLEYDNKEMARAKITIIRSLIKYKKLNNIRVSVKNNKVYVIREDE